LRHQGVGGRGAHQRGHRDAEELGHRLAPLVEASLASMRRR
jgi:hypothetical protein